MLAHIHHNHIADNYQMIQPYFTGKHGLEIGGLSNVFSRVGSFPVYRTAARVDNCNILPTRYRLLYRVPGDNYLLDGTTLGSLHNGYDFVISSHTFEHIANPLKALFQWKNIIRTGGVVFIVCPHKDFTLDHRRPLTTMEHLIDDWMRDTTEYDTTHFEEIDRLTDRSGLVGNSPGYAVKESVDKGLVNNHMRILHHHTFVPELMEEIFKWADLDIVYLKRIEPEHIAIAGVKR